jgi:hypothetical protein
MTACYNRLAFTGFERNACAQLLNLIISIIRLGLVTTGFINKLRHIGCLMLITSIKYRLMIKNFITPRHFSR